MLKAVLVREETNGDNHTGARWRADEKTAWIGYRRYDIEKWVIQNDLYT